MPTYSTYLNLKLNVGSDPFLLSDFVNNWSILDGAPGHFICTSLTRPAWGAAQAGRLIFMTDLKQTSFWDGAAWQDLRNSAPVFAAGVFLNASMARNTSPVFTVLSFTTPRPCALSLFLTATYNCSNQNNQDLWQSLAFDGAKVTGFGYREQVRFSGNASDSGALAGDTAMTLAVIPSVAAGSHTAGIVVDMGTYSTSATLVGAKVLAMISVYNASNVL
jgi:hypothetical protein